MQRVFTGHLLGVNNLLVEVQEQWKTKFWAHVAEAAGEETCKSIKIWLPLLGKLELCYSYSKEVINKNAGVKLGSTP